MKSDVLRFAFDFNMARPIKFLLRQMPKYFREYWQGMTPQMTQLLINKGGGNCSNRSIVIVLFTYMTNSFLF